MVSVVLFMVVAGIGLVLAASDPGQVTLRWLRLGGLIAVVISALGVLAAFQTEASLLGNCWVGFAVMTAAMIAQLLAVQLGHKLFQRIAALSGFVAGSAGTGYALAWVGPAEPATIGLGVAFTAPASCALLGGTLMTMLLGHAYLAAAGQMSQVPFMRLVHLLALILVLRLATSLTAGLWPYWHEHSAPQPWITMMITARYFVGLLVPAVFMYMVRDCVRRRANQSATGILYVTTVLIWMGEGVALLLLGSTGRLF